MPASATRPLAEVLESLHPRAIRNSASIRRLLSRLAEERVFMRRGVDAKIDRETALIEAIGDSSLSLRLQNLAVGTGEDLLLNFEIDQQPYAMAVAIIDVKDELAIGEIPDEIYCAERRDRQRRRFGEGDKYGERVLISRGSQALGYGRVKDYSPDGYGVEVPEELSLRADEGLEVRFLEGDSSGLSKMVAVRHERRSEASGWKRVGLSTTMGADDLMPVDYRVRLGASPWSSMQTGWSLVGAALQKTRERSLPHFLRRSSESQSVRIVDYRNARDECIRAIVDSYGDPRGAPAIVIPPAWGRTKETLLPLAQTIVSSFRAVGQPVVVLRFDGIRRRGESFNELSCRKPGSEYHKFTFSQAVEDILTTIDFLSSAPEFRSEAIVLVTFSAASIDGRRAVARSVGEKLKGWISVVGSADLQSMMRIVSGGVDFVSGVDRGLQFGLNRILGVEVDIDLAGRDALRAKMAFLEDSCRDFEGIRIPVSWFHGRYDAWMEMDRVRIALSAGERSQRKLVEIPTGHQLRSSKEALAVFQLIAAEASEMIDGKRLKAILPKLHELEQRRRAERARLPARVPADKRRFWKSYLLGRDGSLGIELMTGTSLFQQFMADQIRALCLEGSERVVDLAAGTGSFPLQLYRERPHLDVEVVAVDYVVESLKRAKTRLSSTDGCLHQPKFAACDLEVGSQISIPLQDGSCDSAIASLLLGYLDRPFEFFKEVARILRPGGRFVVSGLQKDADVSRIFRAGLDELSSKTAKPHFDLREVRDLPRLSREFLSDAARLMDLEEEGVFDFKEPDEVCSMLREAGFKEVSKSVSFGRPPQAFILTSIRDGLLPPPPLETQPRRRAT